MKNVYRHEGVTETRDDQGDRAKPGSRGGGKRKRVIPYSVQRRNGVVVFNAVNQLVPAAIALEK